MIHAPKLYLVNKLLKINGVFVRRGVFSIGSLNMHICNSDYIASSFTVMSEQLTVKGVEARVMTSFKVTFRRSFEVTEETLFGHSNSLFGHSN